MKQRLDKEQRKAAIIRAALPLFARHGFAATTTKQLARAAGVSEPLLYKHFPSKEDLYNAIQEFTSSESAPLFAEDLEPCAATLVALYAQMLRVFILGKPESSIPWPIRLRLILNSLLEDGAYARLAYENRFAVFASKLEASIEQAIATGDVTPSPVTPRNLAIFCYQTGVWFAVASLPPKRALRYDSAGEELVRQAAWFGLRGIGMSDAAIARHWPGASKQRSSLRKHPLRAARAPRIISRNASS